MSWIFQPIPAAAQLLSGGVSTAGYIKYWDGSQWTKKPVKYWDGSQWTIKPVKYWNGSQWTTTV
jgi:hypothetical protein